MSDNTLSYKANALRINQGIALRHHSPDADISVCGKQIDLK
jgi:hypothetical protein